jgi:F0F1-type ATP synthase assembly protein I
VSQNDGQELGNAARITGLVGQIGCVTGIVSILIIAIAFAIGWFLDSKLGTNGILIVLFLVASFPITLLAIYRIGLATARRSQRPQTVTIDKEIESDSEEETEKS